MSSSDHFSRAAPRTGSHHPGTPGPIGDAPVISEAALEEFTKGVGSGLGGRMGASPVDLDGEHGVRFAVWAPNAVSVELVGDFSDWSAMPLEARGATGMWEGFVAGVQLGSEYRFRITPDEGEPFEKADPFARWAAESPETASRVWWDGYQWDDGEWMARRPDVDLHRSPVSIYEIHLGSWRYPGGSQPTYRSVADPLIDHVRALGFTHVEFLPVMEHPYTGSWGYQSLGFFAPTSRFGTPADFKYLIDRLHQAGIGVILDWVPSHFAVDDFGLARFDGTALFEDPDPRRGFHPDWGTYIFDYSRPHVRSYLLSSARWWIEEFHVDGLRVDAVASMLYLDYSRKDGEWIPNKYGGNENLDAIDFLRSLNEMVYGLGTGVHTWAEESTAWPGVSSPTYVGGLGFGFKWDMGWMHDTLSYLERDPVHRSHHHSEITFRSVYAFSENYTLPLSHDEVVHEKRSLLGKMPGDRWQQFANLRLLLADQFAQPGKNLLFMGAEFGQPAEWNHEGELQWHVLEEPEHRGVLELVAAMSNLYTTLPALHELDHDPAGFEWVDGGDWQRSTLAFERRPSTGDRLLALFNFTPIPHAEYQLPEGTWSVVLNTDDVMFGGSGVEAGIDSEAGTMMLPPLAAVWLVGE